MMKKILAVLLMAALCLSLCACGGANATKLPVLALEETVDPDGTAEAVRKAPTGTYEGTLIGLMTYMEDGQAVIRDTEKVSFAGGKVTVPDDYTAFVQMSYKEIGAADGYRYQFTFNRSTVQAEFYRFDPENLDEKGKTCLAEAKETGHITVLGNSVPVVLHSGGEFLMIYNDSKTEGKKAEAKSVAQKEWAEKLFSEFSTPVLLN